MAITWREPSRVVLDAVEVKRLDDVMSLVNLSSARAVDSYVMSADGPKLSSVFLMSEILLVEVRLNTKFLSFDLADVKKLQNYRVTFGELEHRVADIATPELTAAVLPGVEAGVLIEGTTAASAQVVHRTRFVEISLSHTDTLVTKMSYFGEDATDWVRYVLDAYPPSHLSSSLVD